jgi:serine/threonine-protein kinase SRPK3
MRSIIQAIDGVPAAWEDVLFDSDGQPTKDTAKGEPIWKFTDKRPFKERIYKIWDKPSNATNKPAKSQTVNREENIDRSLLDWDKHDPYPHCFSHKFWKPTSIKVGDEYLNGYSDDSDKLLGSLPKISEEEADLLCNLLSKIFVYEPSERASIKGLLDHPWFHIHLRIWPTTLVP